MSPIRGRMNALDHLVWCGFVLLAMSVVMSWYKRHRWFMEPARRYTLGLAFMNASFQPGGAMLRGSAATAG